MGSYISTPQTSPQLLGISFIENYRFYFQDEKPIDTCNVSNIVKNAFRQQRVHGEIMSLIKQGHTFTAEQILRKLNDLMKIYPGDPNVSRLAFDLSEVKANLTRAEFTINDLNKQISDKLHPSEYENFVKKIKELRHDKRQLEFKLKDVMEEYDQLNSSINETEDNARILQKKTDLLYKENQKLKHQNINLYNELVAKNEEIIILQKAIWLKDNELKEIIYSIVKNTKDLDDLLDLILQLEEQVLFRGNEIRIGFKLLYEAEAALISLEEKISSLTDKFQARISQLEMENSQLRQKVGL
jgi:chromosome segregation ATPase